MGLRKRTFKDRDPLRFYALKHAAAIAVEKDKERFRLVNGG
jgi:hypothetical protein